MLPFQGLPGGPPQDKVPPLWEDVAAPWDIQGVYVPPGGGKWDIQGVHVPPRGLLPVTNLHVTGACRGAATTCPSTRRGCEAHVAPVVDGTGERAAAEDPGAAGDCSVLLVLPLLLVALSALSASASLTVRPMAPSACKRWRNAVWSSRRRSACASDICFLFTSCAMCPSERCFRRWPIISVILAATSSQ